MRTDIVVSLVHLLNNTCMVSIRYWLRLRQGNKWETTWGRPSQHLQTHVPYVFRSFPLTHTHIHTYTHTHTHTHTISVYQNQQTTQIPIVNYLTEHHLLNPDNQLAKVLPKSICVQHYVHFIQALRRQVNRLLSIGKFATCSYTRVCTQCRRWVHAVFWW